MAREGLGDEEMRYQVRFQRAGTIHYGIVRSYGKEVEAAKARGLLIVEDAVLPVAYEVREADVVDLEVKLPGRFDSATGLYVDLSEYDTYVQEAWKAAKAVSDAVASGVCVGSMFTIGVGDGSAHYVVTKVNKKTCRVEWRGFCADRWRDHHFGMGGSFKLEDVARYVESDRAMARLFGKKAKV